MTNLKEKIEGILKRVANDRVWTWQHQKEQDAGIKSYSSEILKLIEDNYVSKEVLKERYKDDYNKLYG